MQGGCRIILRILRGLGGSVGWRLGFWKGGLRRGLRSLKGGSWTGLRRRHGKRVLSEGLCFLSWRLRLRDMKGEFSRDKGRLRAFCIVRC